MGVKSVIIVDFQNLWGFEFRPSQKPYPGGDGLP
jgi:hypothetical protein